MSRLPFEAFLALRYLRPRRTFVSVITVISILGVLLGVAVLIIVISVMSGFDKEWRDSILGFNSHMKIYRAHGAVNDYENVMKKVAANPNVVGVAPLIENLVMLKTQPDEGDGKIYAPILVGVDAEKQGDVSILPTQIKVGQFDLSRHGLIVGTELASMLDLNVGDHVLVYTGESLERMQKTMGKPDEEKIAPNEFVVRGIFDVGFNDFNKSIVVASLEELQKMYHYGEDQAQIIQIKLKDPFQAELVRQQLETQFRDQPYDFSTWKSENESIFSALAVEKNMMFFLLFFIMIVAGFGIVNCQITFVVQKTREIGILKSLGASNRQVLLIFLSQSVVVGVLGVGLGLALALLALHYRNEFLLFMRTATGIELLPATVYKVYDLPALTQFSDVAIICGTAFITCVLAGLFPAWKASRLQPVEALRYE